MRNRIIKQSEIASDPTHRMDAAHYLQDEPGFTPAEIDVIDALWHSLPKVAGHPDRRMTGWGSKTKIGLIATVKRLGKGLHA